MRTRKSQKHRGVKIRPRGKTWQVDFGTRNGIRNQKSYPTIENAKAAIDDFIENRAEQNRLDRIDEKNRRIGLYDLTDMQRMDVMKAIDRLGSHATLEEAVKFYLDHNASPRTDPAPLQT